ncbi:MAG: hypothetical protein J7L73_00080 [Anaerolineales bacterium]|nr:hypothetical protein [Anaerolineales bacterium]
MTMGDAGDCFFTLHSPRSDDGAMVEAASLRYTPLAVTTSSVIARPPEGVVAISLRGTQSIPSF